MYGSCAVGKQSHRNGLSILYVVEGVVTDIKTLGQCLGKSYGNRSGVTLGYAGDMYVKSTKLLAFSKSYVCLAVLYVVNAESQLVCALGKLSTCRNGCAHTVAGNGSFGCNDTVRIGRNVSRCVVSCGRNFGPFGLLVVLIVKAVVFACCLSCKELKREALITKGLFLILVACKFVHVERDCENNRTAGSKLIALGSGLVCKNVSEFSVRSACCKSLFSKLTVYRINVINVDNVGEVGYLALCLNGELPLEVKVAGICYLNILNFSIAGLPVIVCEYWLVVLNLCPTAVGGGKVLVRPIHLGIELTGPDNVAAAYHNVGEPCKGCAEEHGKAEHQRD